MGNLLSCRLPEVSGARLLMLDGTVERLDETVTVAELMLEHPRQFVVKANAISTNTKLTPLPADYTLNSKETYVMLPMANGRRISAEETRRILTMVGALMKPRSLASIAQVMEGRNKKSTQVSSMTEKEKCGVVDHWVTHEGLEERFELLNRQYSSSRGWKPSLGTIEEKCLERKMSHWLY